MAARNRTIVVSDKEKSSICSNLRTLDGAVSKEEIINNIIHQDMMEATAFLPHAFVDMLFLDPPYNLTKKFNGRAFYKTEIEAYSKLLDTWIRAVMHTLKPNASIYICGDWHSSTSIHQIAQKYFSVRNRITWEREKGRGALANWKNCSEDIWFCTLSDDYIFNTEAVKLKRRVIAPYRNQDSSPKDWDEAKDGNYRLTYPSNLWTDLTVPFWSMPENTSHPTQKPEKLLAKLILASTHKDGVVLDPFLGSGTTAVVAKKLGRHFLGIEQEQEYCYLAYKRVLNATSNLDIQGYSSGVFWERNTLSEQKRANKSKSTCAESTSQLGLLEV